jgi:hypothetical protein
LTGGRGLAVNVGGAAELLPYTGTGVGAGKEESGERQIVPLPVVFKIAEAVPVRYRALVLLATFADMRWGELVGLRRQNIDLTGPRQAAV